MKNKNGLVENIASYLNVGVGDHFVLDVHGTLKNCKIDRTYGVRDDKGDSLQLYDILYGKVISVDFRPNINDYYWTINNEGNVSLEEWTDKLVDWQRYHIGAIKRTEKEMFEWLREEYANVTKHEWEK